MTDEVTELPIKLNSLPADTRSEKWAAIKARKAFAAVYTPFVNAMQTVIRAYLEARRQGISRDDASKGVEEVLRSAWPGRPTKFPHKCDACEDTGYEEHVCRPYVRCTREKCNQKGEAWQHLYVTPCQCEKGDKFRPKVYQPQEAAQSVGKVRKPRTGWNRMGA